MPQPQSGFDYLLLIYFAWGGLQGFRGGIARALLSLAGFAAAWVVAGVFTGRLVDLLDTRWGLVSHLRRILRQTLVLPANIAEIKDLTELILALPIPATYRQELARAVERSTVAVASQGVSSPVEVAYHLLGLALVSVVGFALLFVVTRGLFHLFGAAFQSVLERGPLRFFNRAAGAVLGVAGNVATAGLVLGLLVPATTLTDLPWLRDVVDRSNIAGWLLQGFYLLSPWLLPLN